MEERVWTVRQKAKSDRKNRRSHVNKEKYIEVDVGVADVAVSSVASHAGPEAGLGLRAAYPPP